MRLVMLPGMDGTGSLFRGFLDVLPPTTEVVIVRYPFHRALGYAELLDAVRAAVDPLNEYVLVAESFSTPLAVMFAAGQPEGLQGVVLCAGFVTPPVRGVMRWLAERLRWVIFRVPFPSWAARVFLLGIRAPRELLDDVTDAIARVAPDVMARRVVEVLRVDVRKELSEINVPILALFSGDDKVVSDECRPEMLAQKNMKTGTIDGPHMLLQRAPVRCSRLIVDWIKALDSQRASNSDQEAVA